MTEPKRSRLVLVQTGQPQALDPEGQLSAIRKAPVRGRLRVGPEGLEGDAQADRRVHGGPEKAVHQYAFRHYATWAARFPQAAGELVRGSFGENLSTDTHDETTVFIGDCYRAGSTLLQVSQPRRPCWKLDHRFELPGLAQAVQESGWSGWYLRVLEPGELAAGDDLTLVERPRGALSLAQFWTAYHADPVDREALHQLRDLPGLAPAWRQKIAERLAGLAQSNEAQRLAGPRQTRGG